MQVETFTLNNYENEKNKYNTKLSNWTLKCITPYKKVKKVIWNIWHNRSKWNISFDEVV